MWLKIIAFLKLTNRFGCMIKIIEIMAKELAVFMVLFGATIIAFSTILIYLF
jgi:hypothetical protein